MARRFRCPVCGCLGHLSALLKDWEIEIYRPISLGKAHGFRYEKVEDAVLVQAVKAKIVALARRFTEPVFEAIRIPVLSRSSHGVRESMSMEVTSSV